MRPFSSIVVGYGAVGFVRRAGAVRELEASAGRGEDDPGQHEGTTDDDDFH